MTTAMQEANYEYYLKTDIEMYTGEWVAISDGKVIAHGTNVKEVAERARKLMGNRKFLLSKVPGEETLIF